MGNQQPLQSNTAQQLVLAGPILRRAEQGRFILWLATSYPVRIILSLHPQNGERICIAADTLQQVTKCQRAGKHLFFYLLDLPLDTPLPTGIWIGYDLRLQRTTENTASNSQEILGWQRWAPDLVYPGREMPGFILQPGLTKLLHGSCRKPHHASEDGLVRADTYLAQHDPEQWPALLIMSGDQVYVDDVAAPMLVAIHQLTSHLGIAEEVFPDATIDTADTLHTRSPHYYQRQNLLPMTEAGQAVGQIVFGGARKPVFTSVNAENHLISLAEVLAMYLLVWSPTGWNLLDEQQLAVPAQLSAEQRLRFNQELTQIMRFKTDLAMVRRLMAHIPCAMIFDDHDITDDWNLTAEWEQAAYGQPFSKRIIGNALLGYFLCQGWGNAPEVFSADWLEQVQNALDEPGSTAHETCIEQMIEFPDWHYQWPTEPPLIVLDTRTHRWRSEVSPSRPSGLMDWEALTQLQQQLLNHPSVVIVSPAPVFGVKLIEAVQKLFTLLGYPLTVDAENWMAHNGAARTLMNLFHHSRTPQNFVILSGDVHYSFVYDVELRRHDTGPDIWQITSSGIKNEFPAKLLMVFDRINRWLYAPASPLNWFTKRRRMRIIPRKPANSFPGRRLVNKAGIGLVEFRDDGSPSRIAQLCAEGDDIEFSQDEDGAVWE